MKLKLKDIRLDGGTQPRLYINQEIVEDYSERLLEDCVFPPVIVFHDGANYWLTDGFHRYHANKKAGFLDVDCDVRNGTLREAVLFSLSANSTHGLRRTNEDKRNAVLKMLNDPEWGEWSDSEIARHCDVSHVTVGRIRKSLGLEKTQQKYVNKHGQEATMKRPERPSEPVILKPSEVMEQEDRLKELAVAHEELAEENARLLDRLAIKGMIGTDEEKQAAAETIDGLRAQVKALEAELASVKISRDDYQNKCSELIRQVNYWKKEASKAA